jgi:fumarate reductase flavoprotein subunit
MEGSDIMNSEKRSNPEVLDTQIVVIGAGAAGLSAAVSAAENGADVILLEKHSKPGGNSAMAFGPFAAESPAQKRALVDARCDELFRIHMDFCKWEVNPRLVRTFIDKSGDAIQWLEEKGITFELIFHRPNQVPLTHHLSKGKGREIIDVLAKNFEDLGGRLLCQTAATEILMRGKEGVSGVLAIRQNEELQINASSVIIATGGYGGNKELLRKYVPYYNENIHLTGFPNMGDGLLMAFKIGAASEGLGVLQMTPSITQGGGDKLRCISWEPYTVWVNKRGERFIDEAYCYEHSRQEAAFGVVKQPDCIYFSLLDEALVHRIMEEGILLGGHYNPETWSGAKMPDLPELLKSGADKGIIKISNSWDDIASWIGITSETLKATIDEYNCFCDTGYDVFAKDRRYLVALRTPPYYALKCTPRFVVTMGGIKINHHIEVLDHDDKPIPGVYAAGIDAGGWEGEVYDARLSGSGLAFPLVSGRIAGENATKYVLGKR